MKERKKLNFEPATSTESGSPGNQLLSKMSVVTASSSGSGIHASGVIEEPSPMVNIRLNMMSVDQLASLRGVSREEAARFVADRKNGLKASKVREFATDRVIAQLLDFTTHPLSSEEEEAHYYATMIASYRTARRS